jgi:hypothetical protein
MIAHILAIAHFNAPEYLGTEQTHRQCGQLRPRRAGNVGMTRELFVVVVVIVCGDRREACHDSELGRSAEDFM